MNIGQMRKVQENVLSMIYRTGDGSECAAILNLEYDALKREIQLMSGGADTPAYLCDPGLYQFWSDLGKDAYGFRQRGDWNCADLEQMCERAKEEIAATSKADGEWLEQYAEDERRQREQEAAKDQIECELRAAYCTDFDHLDPIL